MVDVTDSRSRYSGRRAELAVKNIDLTVGEVLSKFLFET
jgi:hypothetical protein